MSTLSLPIQGHSLVGHAGILSVLLESVKATLAAHASTTLRASEVAGTYVGGIGSLHGRVLGVLDGHHRTRSQSHHLLGNATQDHVLQSGAAMGRHNDEIGIPLPGEADDRIGRASDCDHDFPRAAVGLRYEITESGQRLVTVVLAYDRRV